MTFRVDDCNNNCLCKDCPQECTTCEDWDQLMVCGCPAKECLYYSDK